MSKRTHPSTAREQEQAFLTAADELFEKSAAAAAPEDAAQFTQVEESRFEDRAPEPPEPTQEEEKTIVPTSSSKWLGRPSVRTQMQEYAQTVRLVNPETMLLNLAVPDELKEFNRIQRASSDQEAPTLAITEIEKQKYEGTWTVLLTFCEVQYMQL